MKPIEALEFQSGPGFKIQDPEKTLPGILNLESSILSPIEIQPLQSVSTGRPCGHKSGEKIPTHFD